MLKVRRCRPNTFGSPCPARSTGNVEENCVAHFEVSPSRTSLLATWSFTPTCTRNFTWARLQTQVEHAPFVNYTVPFAANANQYLLTGLQTDTRYRVCLVFQDTPEIPKSDSAKPCRDAATVTNITLLLGVLIGVLLAVLFSASFCVITRLIAMTKLQSLPDSATKARGCYWLLRLLKLAQLSRASGRQCVKIASRKLDETAAVSKASTRRKLKRPNDFPQPLTPCEAAGSRESKLQKEKTCDSSDKKHRQGSTIHNVLVEMCSAKRATNCRGKRDDVETVVLCNLQCDTGRKSPLEEVSSPDAHYVEKDNSRTAEKKGAKLLPLTSTTLFLHDLETSYFGSNRWSTINRIQLTAQTAAPLEGVYVEFIETL